VAEHGSTLRFLVPFTKEGVGTYYVFLTRSLFGDGIPRRLLPRVSLGKSTYVLVRLRSLRGRNLQLCLVTGYRGEKYASEPV
jgi:hypothetical protein